MEQTHEHRVKGSWIFLPYIENIGSLKGRKITILGDILFMMARSNL